MCLLDSLSICPGLSMCLSWTCCCLVKGCNSLQNNTPSRYQRKSFPLPSMSPKSYFPERHSELLWSVTAKILLMTLCLVTMTSSLPSVYSLLTVNTAGQALVIFGRAFCNIATAQEALGRSLTSSLIIALQRFLDQIKEYEVERKKLETRRCE